MKQILKKLIALGSLAVCAAMNQRGRGVRYTAPGQNVYIGNFGEGVSFNPRVIRNGVLQSGEYTYFDAEPSPPSPPSPTPRRQRSRRKSSSSIPTPTEPFNSFGIPQRPVDNSTINMLNINFPGSTNSIYVGCNSYNKTSDRNYEASCFSRESVIVLKQRGPRDIITQYFGNPTDSKLPFVGIENVEFTENNIDNLDLLILADERLEKMIFYQCKFINQSALKFLLQNPKNVNELRFIDCGLTEDEVKHLQETGEENNILIAIVS